MIDFTKFVEWAFMGLTSSAGAAVCFLLWRILLSIRDTQASLAQLVERTSWHGKSLDTLTDRIFHLERRK